MPCLQPESDAAAGTGGAETGYAIPIDSAMAVEREIATRQPVRGVSLGVDGFLGVIVAPGTDSSPAVQQAQERGVVTAAGGGSSRCIPAQQDVTVPATIAPVPAGALVVGVLCGTGAATAGIFAGDVITTANGHEIESAGALTAVVGGTRPGTVMRVTWVSPSGVPRSSSIRLGPAPAA